MPKPITDSDNNNSPKVSTRPLPLPPLPKLDANSAASAPPIIMSVPRALPKLPLQSLSHKSNANSASTISVLSSSTPPAIQQPLSRPQSMPSDTSNVNSNLLKLNTLPATSKAPTIPIRAQSLPPTTSESSTTLFRTLPQPTKHTSAAAITSISTLPPVESVTQSIVKVQQNRPLPESLISLNDFANHYNGLKVFTREVCNIMSLVATQITIFNKKTMLFKQHPPVEDKNKSVYPAESDIQWLYSVKNEIKWLFQIFWELQNTSEKTIDQHFVNDLKNINKDFKWVEYKMNFDKKLERIIDVDYEGITEWYLVITEGSNEEIIEDVVVAQEKIRLSLLNLEQIIIKFWAVINTSSFKKYMSAMCAVTNFFEEKSVLITELDVASNKLLDATYGKKPEAFRRISKNYTQMQEEQPCEDSNLKQKFSDIVPRLMVFLQKYELPLKEIKKQLYKVSGSPFRTDFVNKVDAIILYFKKFNYLINDLLKFIPRSSRNLPSTYLELFNEISIKDGNCEILGDYIYSLATERNKEIQQDNSLAENKRATYLLDQATFTEKLKSQLKTRCAPREVASSMLYFKKTIQYPEASDIYKIIYLAAEAIYSAWGDGSNKENNENLMNNINQLRDLINEHARQYFEIVINHFGLGNDDESASSQIFKKIEITQALNKAKLLPEQVIEIDLLILKILAKNFAAMDQVVAKIFDSKNEINLEILFIFSELGHAHSMNNLGVHFKENSTAASACYEAAYLFARERDLQTILDNFKTPFKDLMKSKAENIQPAINKRAETLLPILQEKIKQAKEDPLKSSRILKIYLEKAELVLQAVATQKAANRQSNRMSRILPTFFSNTPPELDSQPAEVRPLITQCYEYLGEAKKVLKTMENSSELQIQYDALQKRLQENFTADERKALAGVSKLNRNTVKLPNGSPLQGFSYGRIPTNR
jgi:hypothetical protein